MGDRAVLDAGLGHTHRQDQQAAVLPVLVIQDTGGHDDHRIGGRYPAALLRTPLGGYLRMLRTHRSPHLGTDLDAVHRMRVFLRCTCHQEAHAEDPRLLRLLKTGS